MRSNSQQYDCRYHFYAEVRTCRIDASSPGEAARFMQSLDWGPGCGPIGEPVAHTAFSTTLARLRHRWNVLAGAVAVLPRRDDVIQHH